MSILQLAMHTLQACSRAVVVNCGSLSAGRQRVFFLPFSPRIRRDAAAVSLLREAVLYEIKTEAPLEKRKPAFVGLRRFCYVPAAEIYEAKV